MGIVSSASVWMKVEPSHHHTDLNSLNTYPKRDCWITQLFFFRVLERIIHFFQEPYYFKSALTKCKNSLFCSASPICIISCHLTVYSFPATQLLWLFSCPLFPADAYSLCSLLLSVHLEKQSSLLTLYNGFIGEIFTCCYILTVCFSKAWLPGL